VNPYTNPGAAPAAHVCDPVAQIGKMTSSLTYSTYFGKYILVGQQGAPVPGFYYSLSDDLLHWTRDKLLMQAPLDWTHRCDQPNPVRDPSLIDAGSLTTNFETTRQRAYLYFTRFNYDYDGFGNCSQTLDRDLIRIPIEFSGQSPPPPPPPPPPASSEPSPAPATQTAAAPTPVTTTTCTHARSHRDRLVRQVRSTRRKLAHAHGRAAKQRYRRLLRVRKHRLARARRVLKTACGTSTG
jgi:hypothetical protein